MLAPHFSYVKNKNPGLLLFLFNYNNWELYGIYEAASSGKMNINPYGCTLDGFGELNFLHRFYVMLSSYLVVLMITYSNDQHNFMFELDHVQATHLISKFSSCVLTLIILESIHKMRT
ncbi:hypothetical protein H5410_005534 [Solanum commersonii]|uniref:DCD domain-containing protein n=1 Tax=Solanum commersonii TaxID=4109 RepID=A0A9J6A7T7_SOLCO|nr:hypothetical protein H5410_005534 [Solanum commersonii]